MVFSGNSIWEQTEYIWNVFEEITIMLHAILCIWNKRNILFCWSDYNCMPSRFSWKYSQNRTENGWFLNEYGSVRISKANQLSSKEKFQKLWLMIVNSQTSTHRECVKFIFRGYPNRIPSVANTKSNIITKYGFLWLMELNKLGHRNACEC